MAVGLEVCVWLTDCVFVWLGVWVELVDCDCVAVVLGVLDSVSVCVSVTE